MEEKDLKVEPQSGSPVNKEHASVSPQNNKIPLIKFFIGIVLLELLILGGVFGLHYYNQIQLSKAKLVAEKVRFAPTPTVAQKEQQYIAMDTSNWKTYTDPSTSFVTKYPQELSLLQESDSGFTYFRNLPAPTGEECIDIRFSTAKIDKSQNLRDWVKEKYPYRLNAGPPGQNQTSSEIHPYTNSINGSITGYWMPIGAEVTGKTIFISGNGLVAILTFPGCAGTGDTYEVHPKTMSIMENMISTFQFPPPLKIN